MQVANDDTFQTILADAGSDVIIDFWADWCQFCKQLMPKLEKLEQEYPDITFIKVNVEESYSVANYFAVRGLPTLAYVRNGSVLGMQQGNIPETELRDWIKTQREYST